MQATDHQELNSDLTDAAIAAATAVREQAHAPYSQFRVGAVLIDDEGGFHSGCNVENASYGLTICAERNAVFAAVAKGKRRFIAVVVVTDAQQPTAPCGACRQVLHEFSPDMVVISRTVDGAEHRSTLTELLPHSFSGSSLL